MTKEKSLRHADVTRRAMLGISAGGALAASLPGRAAARAREGKAQVLAPTPPMGWNSWNSFATTITEEQALEQARIMARELLPAGYDILTVDIQWYEPQASGYAYSERPVPTLDGFGRLIPAPNRFPSSAQGKGFRPLADKVHAMGLRFGVHLMRGIPRLAVERNLPVLGHAATAAQIADRTSTCPWNPDMYGVDMTRPGAQAYYDSVFAQLAAWGVDFVKVDDLSRPYDSHVREIEAIHLAIQRSGRPMILSMSPGETPVARGAHARRHAQMWRISDDFWDEWPQLEAQFTRLENWNAFMGPGGWPDADMLPLGRLALGQRDSRFTPAEQRTLMTLWSIARSPLIMGGDLRHLDAPTLALLTNPEVISVNQKSSRNTPHFIEDGTRIWTAASPDSGHYLAVFNTTAQERKVSVPLGRLGLPGALSVRNLWDRRADGTAQGALTRAIPAHGAGLYLLNRI